MQGNAAFAADDAWLARQPALQQGYVRQLSQQQQLEQQLADFQAGIYKATLAQHISCGCPTCGQDQLRQLRLVPVLIIDVNCRMQLSVPVLQCCNQGCGTTTAVQPLQLSCWPSNPNKGFDLTKATAEEQQVWFTMRLMVHADTTLMVVRRVPMYR